MNKCKNCKYWKRNTNKYDLKDFGKCNCKKIEYKERYEYDEKYKDDMLLYWDYEGYSADLETGKNFGCIHFKGSDNND